MKKFQLLAMLILTTLLSNGQEKAERIKSEIEAIKTVDQAKKYLAEQSKDLYGTLYAFDSSDSSQMAKDILASEVGEILEYESAEQKIKYIIKIISKESVVMRRVQYIFLDNRKISVGQIDSLRNVILKRLSSGEPFEVLAREYSMDGNATNGGDMGWFDDEMLVKEFTDAVKSHEHGQVFKVDVVNEKWYYVVKNSHRPKTDKKTVVLYIEAKNGQ